MRLFPMFDISDAHKLASSRVPQIDVVAGAFQELRPIAHFSREIGRL